MADAAVDLGATNLFSLGAEFHAQSSETEPFSTEELALTSTGDKACTNDHDAGTNYSARYKYCGSDLVGDLSTIASSFGGVTNSILVTGMDIDFPGPGAQPEITMTGHNHDVNAHEAGSNPPNTFNISGIIPEAGVGVPSLIVSAGESASTASRSSASLSFALNHIDKEGNAGHFVGESITCRCDLSVDYEGNAGAMTAGAWLQILVALSDANEDTDTSSVSAHQYIDAS